MSDDNDFLRTGDRSFRMTADVTALMLKGAGYALIFCLLLGIGWAVLVGISNLLPPQSKEQWDPTPTSHLMAPTEDVSVA